MLVRMMETYDLSTAQEKMGLIAIRTPSLSAINQKWPGFVQNFKYVRPVGVNVSLSCASMMPVDPLQVGQTAGAVAPSDMFNPLLYKVLTNDSWNGLVNRIYASSGATTSLSDVVKMSAGADAFPTASTTNSTDAYYGLLADKSFKKVHPQAGMNVRGVRPLVWTLLHTFGMPLNGTAQLSPPGSDAPAVTPGGDGTATASAQGSYLRGHPQAYPRLPCMLIGGGTPTLGYLPTVYCLVLVTPPSKLHLLYYRLVVTWDIEFSYPMSVAEYGLLSQVATSGRYSHLENYATEIGSAKALAEVSETAQEVDEGRTVESDGVSLDLIMER